MSLIVDIKKDFGNFLLAISLETDSRMLGILGPSGCGKSMMLRCIAGIEKPDAGKIILNGMTLFDSGRHINLPPQKRCVGYLFQNYGLFPNMTVEQNITCGMRRMKNPQEKKRKVQTLINRMMLDGLQKRHPHQLSGGQQQRTALARILAGKPDLLLLDEPFSALDSYLRVQLQTEMKHILKEYDRDAILVSHSRDEVYRLSKDLAIMEDGHLIGYGGVKEMFANPGSCRGAVLTGCKNIVEAVRSGEYEVTVPSWGMKFTTAAPVEKNTCSIGIRAHYFHPDLQQNAGEIELVEEVEEPFEWIVKFRYRGADEKADPVWWRMSKEQRPEKLPEKLGITPQNIMILYG